MNRICGNESFQSTRGAKVVVLTSALVVGVLAIGTYDARADPAPAPQKLWRQFPLDARGHSTANKPSATATTATTSEGRGDGTPMSAAVWAATAGAIVLALLAVAVIAGRLRVHVPSQLKRWTIRRPPIRERVAELVEARPAPPRRRTVAARNGRRKTPRRAVRVPVHESEEAVLKRKGATLEAEADAKLRAKSRNGSSREDELMLLKAKQERKP